MIRTADGLKELIVVSGWQLPRKQGHQSYSYKELKPANLPGFSKLGRGSRSSDEMVALA